MANEADEQLGDPFWTAPQDQPTAWWKLIPLPARNVYGCTGCRFAMAVDQADGARALRCSNWQMLAHRKSHQKFQDMVNSEKYYCMQWSSRFK